MLRFVVCLGVSVLLTASLVVASDDPPTGDLARLQGAWTVVSGKRDGKPMDPSRIKDRRVVIRGTSFVDENTTKKQILGRGTMKIDESRTPRWVDATFDHGELSGKSCKAIYAIEGDTFRTCTGVEGADRPTSLESQPGTRQMSFVYRRAK